MAVDDGVTARVMFCYFVTSSYSPSNQFWHAQNVGHLLLMTESTDAHLVLPSRLLIIFTPAQLSCWVPYLASQSATLYRFQSPLRGTFTAAGLRSGIRGW